MQHLRILKFGYQYRKLRISRVLPVTAFSTEKKNVDGATAIYVKNEDRKVYLRKIFKDYTELKTYFGYKKGGGGVFGVGGVTGRRNAKQRPQFYEVAPQSINGELLYNREEASRELVSCMLSGGGNKLTPVCDDSFGSGKTSLIFKFRKVVNKMIKEERWTAPDKYHLLRDAVYVHVPFSISGMRKSTLGDCEQVVLSTLSSALITSCRSADVALPTTSVEDFCRGLAISCGHDTRLLLHFDEVGCFETFGTQLGISMIYTIWIIGDKLRSQGHFFTMTGRSALLRLVGTGVLNFGAFQSPDRTQVVRLPPLDEEAVRAILVEFKLKDCFIGEAPLIHELTGGIPRAIYTVAKYLAVNEERVGSVKEVLPGIFGALDLNCGPHLGPEDKGVFRTCLEMAWAGLYFTDNMSLGGEAINSVIARLGIFRGAEVRRSDGTVQFQLCVPPYVYRTHLPSVRSLFAIKEHEEKGSRLEVGGRRVLHLRFRLGPCTNWDEVGLPSLAAAGVQFPAVPLKSSYAFPKIAKGNAWKEEDIVAFMEASHGAPDDDVSSTRTEFARDALPSIFQKMHVGQWYQSLPKAGCADAHMRCTESVVVDFQFKNTKDAVSESNARTEAKKSVAHGFSVYLVIVCVEGNGEAEDKVLVDDAAFPGVTVILLSRASVRQFLGENLVESYSSVSALVDSKVRLGVTSAEQALGLRDVVEKMDLLGLKE